MSHNKCFDNFTTSEVVSGKLTVRCEQCGGALGRGATRFCSQACCSANRAEASATSTVDRFWSKVKVGSPNECWPWQASVIGSHGYKYGQFSSGRGHGNVYAHRYAWELTSGAAVPNGLVVLHACDNTLCCNPNHLSVGTQGDNLRDASAKGHFKVPRPTAHKIPTDQLKEVDRLLAAGEPQAHIARRFGVSKGWVSQYAMGSRRQYDRPMAGAKQGAA